jgi:hypothetical protein
MYELGRPLNDVLKDDIEFLDECVVDEGKTSTGVALLDCAYPVWIDRADEDGEVDGEFEGVEARLDE